MDLRLKVHPAWPADQAPKGAAEVRPTGKRNLGPTPDPGVTVGRAVTPEALSNLIEIVVEAAELVLRVYQEPFQVEYKKPGDPVTAADRAANEFICGRLVQAFPGVPLVAEESPPESFQDFRRSERILLIDPLDGTRDFVQRNGEFVVMIALVEGDRAVASVIHAPVSGITWFGWVGHGAFRVTATGVRTEIRVSETAELGAARLLSSRSHRSPRMDRALAALGTRQTLTLGSAGLKGAQVAEGGADAYVAPFYAGQLWDVGPVDALVHAAGGRVSDADGNAIDYRGKVVQDRGLVATNSMLHQAALERLARVRQEST